MKSKNETKTIRANRSARIVFNQDAIIPGLGADTFHFVQDSNSMFLSIFPSSLISTSIFSPLDTETFLFTLFPISLMSYFFIQPSFNPDPIFDTTFPLPTEKEQLVILWKPNTAFPIKFIFLPLPKIIYFLFIAEHSPFSIFFSFIPFSQILISILILHQTSTRRNILLIYIAPIFPLQSFHCMGEVFNFQIYFSHPLMKLFLKLPPFFCENILFLCQYGYLLFDNFQIFQKRCQGILRHKGTHELFSLFLNKGIRCEGQVFKSDSCKGICFFLQSEPSNDRTPFKGGSITYCYRIPHYSQGQGADQFLRYIKLIINAWIHRKLFTKQIHILIQM